MTDVLASWLDIEVSLAEQRLSQLRRLRAEHLAAARAESSDTAAFRALETVTLDLLRRVDAGTTEDELVQAVGGTRALGGHKSAVTRVARGIWPDMEVWSYTWDDDGRLVTHVATEVLDAARPVWSDQGAE